MSCESCGGPCADYKGSVWGWTCRKCIADNLTAQAVRADARDHRERAKRLTQYRNKIGAPA